MSSETSNSVALKARFSRARQATIDWLFETRDTWIQLTWADRPARIRTLLLLCVFITLGAVAVGFATLVRYGQEVEHPLRPSPAEKSGGPIPLPASPLEFTLSPDQLRSLSAEDARTVNAGIAISPEPNQPARPFITPEGFAATADFVRAVDCLTAAVYYEAAYETPAGQAGVAQVVLNRARNSVYPTTVCGVVFQGSERRTGCQFSFTCDGALSRVPDIVRWEASRATALAALAGSVAPAVGNATHYHADYVSPYWAPTLNKIGQIGAHIFYRWPGTLGLPNSFSRVYAGREPVITKLDRLIAGGFGYLPPSAPPEILETNSLVLPTAALASLAPVIIPHASAPESTNVAEPETVEPLAPARPAQQITAASAHRDPAQPTASAPATQTRRNSRIAAPSAW